MDKDLAKSVLVARKKPRNFAIIAKGSTPLHLIISKKPIKDADTKAAKRQFEGNAITQGIVTDDLENEKGLVFKVIELPAVGEVKLRKFITEATELNFKARFEVVESIVRIDDDSSDDDQFEDTTESSLGNPTSSQDPPNGEPRWCHPTCEKLA